MNKQIEVEAKTVDEAIEIALSTLDVSREDIEVEILEREAKGMFGFIKSKNAKILVKYSEGLDKTAVLFLKNIFLNMNLTVDMDVTYKDHEINIVLSGNEMGTIIGRRGETLDALQYLTTLVVNKSSEEYYKISLDTENYRQEREKTLINLAGRLAQKAKRTKRSVSLEPMNSYERKIIHSALQDDNAITTHSVGDEPNRKIIITPKGYKGYSNYKRNDYAKRPPREGRSYPPRTEASKQTL